MVEIIRERELAEVSGGLARGAWYVIYAPSSSGKTTFLGQLSKHVGHAYTVKYVNLRAVRGLGTGEVFGHIAGLLSMGKTFSFGRGTLSYPPGPTVFRSGASHCALGNGEALARIPVCTPLELRELFLECEGKLLLLLDDVGTLRPEAAAAVLGLLSALQSELSLNPRLSGLRVVAASSIDLQGAGPEILSGLNSWEEYFLPDFTAREVRNLAGHGGPNKDAGANHYIGESRDEGAEVWRLAEGHPWLTAYLLKQRRLRNIRTGVWEIPLLQNLRARLDSDLFIGYDQGKWTSPGESRRLRLLGLAKYQDGELVVRNSIFRGIAEGWLYQGEPGRSRLITGREVREGAVLYEKIDRAKEAHEKLGAKSPGPDTKRLDRGLEQGTKEERINNNGKNEMGTGDVPITLYRESKELILDGKTIPLTPVEYRIVESLLSNYPRILSKDNLAQAAFPFEPVPLTDVESHIKNIRRKLGDKPKRPRFIRCRRGFGYQAVADSFTLS